MEIQAESSITDEPEIVEQPDTSDVTATTSRIDTVKRFRKRAAEGLQKQAEKMTVVSYKKVAKPLVGKNV